MGMDILYTHFNCPTGNLFLHKYNTIYPISRMVFLFHHKRFLTRDRECFYSKSNKYKKTNKNVKKICLKIQIKIQFRIRNMTIIAFFVLFCFVSRVVVNGFGRFWICGKIKNDLLKKKKKRKKIATPGFVHKWLFF